MPRTSSLQSLALVLALLAPAGLARAADEEEVRKLTADAERIGKVMEGVRGLKFSGPVKKGIQSREELRAFVLEEIEKEMPDAKVRAQEKAYQKMGFLPKGLDLKKTIVDLYSEQIAAFYNPEKKELFLIEKGGPEQSMIMAHELTHALQDQNFDLLPMQKGIVDNDDRALALTSVIEGDATVAMIGYTFKEQGLPMDVKSLPIDIGQMMKMQAQLGEALGGGKGQAQLKNAPKVLSQNMLFGYVEGAGFCHKLIKKKGGYDAVSAAFHDLPTSSEQILHPEKYLGKERDLPVEVTLPDIAAALGGGWKLLLKNVMGEFNTALLFEEKLAKGRAEKAAAGWGGDAWQVLEGPEGEVVFAWYSTWDSEDDAQEFAETYRAFSEKRGDGDRLDVERRGERVAIVDGPFSDAALERIGEAFDRAETRTGYPPIGAVAAARAPEGDEAGPFAKLTRPEGWTEVARGADEEQPYDWKWRSPDGVHVAALESAAAHRNGAQAAEAAAKAIREQLGERLGEGGVKVDKRTWRGKPAGRISYSTGPENRCLAYYMVLDGRQYVLEISGKPDALRAAFRAFREANPGVVPEDEGPARPGNKHDAEPGKKKEPTLF